MDDCAEDAGRMELDPSSSGTNMLNNETVFKLPIRDLESSVADERELKQEGGDDA